MKDRQDQIRSEYAERLRQLKALKKEAVHILQDKVMQGDLVWQMLNEIKTDDKLRPEDAK